jgi:hypothetical protein
MRAEKDLIRTTSSAPMAIDGRAGKGRKREIASATICRPDQSRAARPPVMGLEMRPNVRKVDETVDPAQHVIVRDVPLEAEAIEQRLLHHPPFAHHRPNLLSQPQGNQRRTRQSSGVFQRNSSTPAVCCAQKPAIR